MPLELEGQRLCFPVLVVPVYLAGLLWLLGQEQRRFVRLLAVAVYNVAVFLPDLHLERVVR